MIGILRGILKGSKSIFVIVELIVLAVIALLAITVFNAEYLFQWAMHNWKFYMFLSGIVLLLLLINKHFVSLFMTIGIAVGIFVGNFGGESLKELNESKIVEGMRAEEVYRLRHHPGFEIWMGVIFIFIIIGTVIQRRQGNS